MKKMVIRIGLLGLILIIGIYAKGELYDPKHKDGDLKTEVKLLLNNNEIKKNSSRLYI